jgi:glycogen(starch) synthase
MALENLHIDHEKNAQALLVECAWEVCNQVGGIYTVIRSKVPAAKEKWGNNYCLLGPYFYNQAAAAFDPIVDLDSDPFGEVIKRVRAKGIEVHYGHWLVTGRPRVVLFNPFSAYHQLGQAKYELWENHGISIPDEDLINQVIAFGYCTQLFFHEFYAVKGKDQKIIGHFHEWMAATSLPNLRKYLPEVSYVFTTHATMLGRYLAMNDPLFYEYLSFYNWENEAKHFNIEAQVRIERAAAHAAHVLTTVSEVTALECVHLLGRDPEVILPNGLNIERFVALHEFQNLHLKFKEKIHQFVMGHFFQSYSFDLDKTLYFFTSGRYEYQNKGYDVCIEALARLNYMMQQANIDVTVVFFFITKRPYKSILPHVLESRAVMEEIRQTCEDIQKQVGDRLFYATAASSEYKMPDLNNFVDDTMRLRLRRTLQSWKSSNLPPIVTHSLYEDDGILNFLRSANLVNNQHDKVKIVYHPDFISVTNPLFGLEYGQFVRGCHLGIFPSYYEPWGYTPLECIARGVPAVTSDLSGFGNYAIRNLPDHEKNGLYVVHRQHKLFHDTAQELADKLLRFVKLTRRDRIHLRNNVEESSVHFDWSNLLYRYEQAYTLALNRV